MSVFLGGQRQVFAIIEISGWLFFRQICANLKILLVELLGISPPDRLLMAVLDPLGYQSAQVGTLLRQVGWWCTGVPHGLGVTDG